MPSCLVRQPAAADDGVRRGRQLLASALAELPRLLAEEDAVLVHLEFDALPELGGRLRLQVLRRSPLRQ